MDKSPKKLFASSCLFCANSSTSVRKFKITEDYGGGNTIRYDLTSFLGHQIEPYLKDEDLLCSNCMNFFENMAYTKRRLIDFLRNRDESEDIKMQGFNDIWKGFKKFAVNLVKFNPNESEENWDSSEIRCRSVTPNPLVHTYSEPYNQDYEKEFSEFERARSKSNLWERHSDTDLEVRGILGKRGRRKKRGHNWSRRRGEQKSRALSRTYPAIYDSYERNCYSSMTQISRSSSVKSSESSKTISSKRKRRTVEGKPAKTRSVSRLETYLAKVTAEKESKKYYCEEANCSLLFERIENFVLHKRFDHNIIARFPCNQCRFKGTNRRELDIHHNKLHDREMIMCFQCRAEFQGTYNLQEHLRQHQEYSIGCKFCYLNFLSKADLVEHVAEEHQGKRKKKIHERRSLVFQSLFNKEKDSKKIIGNFNNNETSTNSKEFKAIVLNVEKSPSPEPSPFVHSDHFISKTISCKSPTVISDYLVCGPTTDAMGVVERTDCELPKKTVGSNKEQIFCTAQNDGVLISKEKSMVNLIHSKENSQLENMIPVVILERLDYIQSEPNF